MGLVFAGEVYGGSGGLGYFNAYTASRKLNADITAAETRRQNHQYTELEDHRSCLELDTVRRADCREGMGRRLDSRKIRVKQKAFTRIRWRASAG